MENSNQIDVLGKVQFSLLEFIKNFQTNPFEYFYEEDLRSGLVNRLIRRIKLRKEFPTLLYNNVLKIDHVNSTIVKSEYPSSQRFDIAILGYSHKLDFYNQPIQVAIELKLGSHKIHSDQTSGFKSDIKKLYSYSNAIKNHNFTGLALYFCQTDISNEEVDKWYLDLEKQFSLINLDEINFKPDKIYALIIPAIQSNQVFILRFN